MITKLLSNSVSLLLICGVVSASALAVEDSALLNVLVKKGILTTQEALLLRDEMADESEKTVIDTVSGGKLTTALSIYGRVQLQHVNFSSDGAGVAHTNHFLGRRIRLGVKAQLGEHWVTDLNYEYGAQIIDRLLVAYLTEIGNTPVSVGFGIRKVNFGLEENKSSSRLKAIERSGTTRYFVEANNGRRLGAGKQRVGVFFDAYNAARSGKSTGFYYGVAITNPELPIGVAGAISAGTALTNEFAFWADAGYTGQLDSVSYRIGAAGGYLPNQGGPQALVGRDGSDLQVFSIYGDFKAGAFSLATEFLTSSMDDGAAVGVDASPWGVWVEPSYMVSDNFEFTARASYTDSDGRGIRVSDGVRSARASLVGDNLTEVFIGFSYYILGNDLKIQTGYVRGWADKNGTEEKSDGIRSTLAVNF